MKKDEIVCVATFTAKDGKANELQEAMYALIEPTRKEAGCIRYELNQSLDNPNIFTMIERFKDKDAFESHSNQPHLENFKENAIKDLVKSMSINLYNELI